jgi:hypothetical protein
LIGVNPLWVCYHSRYSVFDPGRAKTIGFWVVLTGPHPCSISYLFDFLVWKNTQDCFAHLLLRPRISYFSTRLGLFFNEKWYFRDHRSGCSRSSVLFGRSHF